MPMMQQATPGMLNILETFPFFYDPAGVIQSKDCVIVNLKDCN